MKAAQERPGNPLFPGQSYAALLRTASITLYASIATVANAIFVA